MYWTQILWCTISCVLEENAFLQSPFALILPPIIIMFFHFSFLLEKPSDYCSNLKMYWWTHFNQFYLILNFFLINFLNRFYYWEHFYLIREDGVVFALTYLLQYLQPCFIGNAFLSRLAWSIAIFAAKYVPNFISLSLIIDSIHYVEFCFFHYSILYIKFNNLYLFYLFNIIYINPTFYIAKLPSALISSILHNNS